MLKKLTEYANLVAKGRMHNETAKALMAVCNDLKDKINEHTKAAQECIEKLSGIDLQNEESKDAK